MTIPLIKILGIETSCDETAIAVVTSERKILSHFVLSQKEHIPYGGVVPEIAARSHLEVLDSMILTVMQEAQLDFSELDGIAVTAGPGLVGGLMVGLVMAKSIASAAQLPLLAIHHLEAHALTVRLTEDIAFPYLLLLVSGGHSQFIVVEGVGKYKILGSTLDDAVGESFDKVAKMLGLPYPGGPSIEKHAKDGDPFQFSFPIPLKMRDNCDLSFSGLKTAVRNTILSLLPLSDILIKDICASFQYTIGIILTQKLRCAMQNFRELYNEKKTYTCVIAGGVASNLHLRNVLSRLCVEENFLFHVPPVSLCTDNGAMIAWAGIERFESGVFDDLSVSPKARWSLESLT